MPECLHIIFSATLFLSIIAPHVALTTSHSVDWLLNPHRDANNYVAEERGAIFTNYSSLSLVTGQWSDYKMLERVGKGKFSVVYRGIYKPTKEQVALKFLIYPVEDDRIKRELKVMDSLRGVPNTVQLLDFVEEPKYNTKVVVMNYVHQGTSYKKLFATFSDWDVRYYLHELLVALREVHAHGIVHRDLKPLNIVYSPKKKELAICDWGTADFHIPGVKQKTKLGTKQYKSPELLLRKTDYDYKIDMWTVGVTMASLMFRMYPFFEAEDDVDQLENIVALLGTPALLNVLKKYDLKLTQPQKAALTHFYEAPEPGWEDFLDDENVHLSSPEGWDLLNKLLTFDPEDRFSADQALRHDYFLPIRECWVDVPPVQWPYVYEYVQN